jgi:3-deoxy-D-manno-octulosonate 8-phosphate phosphatase (KDO 8-P phosphatase)
MPKSLNLNSDVSSIRAVFFDFDGVFTDNNVYLTDQGSELVRCSRYDGYGLQYLRSRSIHTAIISSETVPLAALRAKKLGIPCFQPVTDKLSFALGYLRKLEMSLSELCFMGNDINDLSLLQVCAFPVVPSDAHHSLIDSHFFMTSAKGGQGCVRELCDHFAKLS